MTRIYVMVSTIAEFVPGYEAIVWNGVVAPKDTSVGIINQLNSAFTTSLVDLQVTMTAAEFGKFVAEDTAKWGKVIQVANIKLG